MSAVIAFLAPLIVSILMDMGRIGHAIMVGILLCILFAPLTFLLWFYF